ncbi:MAG: amidase [Actinomycetota bacterium]|nr:amidase [Actinomycetota bacterium]
MPELAFLSALEQAALVRSGEVSPVELVDDAIARIEKFNPELNAVIYTRFDQARAEAAGEIPDGPFRGVPMLVKDLDGHSAGDPYHAGMAALKAAGYTPTHDTYNVAKLRAAGFVFLGKTNCSELGLLPTAEPLAYGPTRSPWDATRSSGGSSGGSAVAVATGMVAVATAGDGGGSIRVPASMCGIFGLKPSRGRVSVGPDHGEMWEGLVHRGALTRGVADAAAVLDVIAGEMPGDPYTAPPPARSFADEVGVSPGELRIGVTTRVPAGLAETQPDAVAAVDSAVRLLESLGHRVEEAHPAALDEDLAEGFITMLAASTRFELDYWGTRIGRVLTAADVEPHTWMLAEMGNEVTAPHYVGAIDSLHALARRVSEWWTEYDVLLTPTVPEPPPPLGAYDVTPDDPMRALVKASQVIPFVGGFNVTGQPAMSVPLYWNDEGLPIGVQLVAAYGREDVLIRLGSQLEEAQPWADRRPPIG